MPKRLTTKEIIDQFQALHGFDRYDYSKVEWINAKTKVCIICPEHGEFTQRPDSHKAGNGCPKCAAIKKTQEEVIADFEAVHSLNKYDYSKAQYVGAHTKICIICPEHGEFTQTPDSHKNGNGCPECGALKSADARRSSFDDVISEFTAIHGVGTYDYSKVQYVSSVSKVCIICPEHGEFLQTPGKHKSGHGCPKCGGSSPLTTADVIAQFESVHGVGRYDYSKVEYVNARKQVRIICTEHGEFLQKPDNHKRGAGCPKCAGRSLSREEVVAGFLAKHGPNRYDYSKVEYVTSETKICIICPEHGEFLQTPYEHKRGAGCPKCAGLAKLTTEEAIADFEAVHGTGAYDYSKVEYVNAQTKVCIICPEHGEFWQKPNAHKSGKGCSKCVGRDLSTGEVIVEFEVVHGVSTYDYTKVNYVDARTNVCIICPLHGEFWQSPNKHKGGHGCPACGGSEKLTIEQVIAEFNAAHGEGEYDYSRVKYVNSSTNVCIVCPEHGEFWQTPTSHKNGGTCPKCRFLKLGLERRLEREDVIEAFKKVHGADRYDYSNVEYVTGNDKIYIVCPEHGEFWQTPNMHKSGQGCPSCASFGFDPDKPAVLYYLRVEARNQTFWKIGISNREVMDRFRAPDRRLITILHEEWYDNGADALAREKAIKFAHNDCRYKGPDILSSGNTELFTRDVLGLDASRAYS
jgi:hypothetical protein